MRRKEQEEGEKRRMEILKRERRKIEGIEQGEKGQEVGGR